MGKITAIGDFVCYNCPSIVLNKKFEFDEEDIKAGNIEEMSITCPNCGSVTKHTFNPIFKNFYIALVSRGYICQCILEDTLGFAITPCPSNTALRDAEQPIEFDIDIDKGNNGKPVLIISNGRIKAGDYDVLKDIGMTEEEYYNAALESLCEWAASLPESELIEEASIEDVSEEDKEFVDPSEEYEESYQAALDIFDDDDDEEIDEEDDTFDSEDDSDVDFEPVGEVNYDA